MSFTVGASERFRLRKGDAKTAEVTSAATTDTTSALHLSKPNETHSSSTRMIGFEVGGQGRGVILNGTSDSNAPSFSTGSDRRLKKNITAYTGGYDKIKSIPVQTWDEQFTDATGVKGWIADELETVFPEAVDGTANATKNVTNAILDKDGRLVEENTTEARLKTMQSIGKMPNCTFVSSATVPVYQYSSPLRFFPDVVQALQKSIEKIETLETEITALKARVTTLEG